MSRERLGRYGENPHLVGELERDADYKGPTVLNTPLHGPEVGYNNLIDANAALEVLIDLAADEIWGLLHEENAGAVVIKHGNPCGLALAKHQREAFENAWKGDEISAYGSIVGFSEPLDLHAAKAMSGKYIEVVIAPKVTPDALEWIKSNPKRNNMRVIQTGRIPRLGEDDAWYTSIPVQEEVRSIRGGKLFQKQEPKFYLSDPSEVIIGRTEFVTVTEPNSDTKYKVGTVTEHAGFDENDLILIDFGLVATKHTKSNAIVIAYNYGDDDNWGYRVLGMGAGQPNRLKSVELAVDKARENLRRQYFEEKGLDYQQAIDRMLRDKDYAEELGGEINHYIRNILGSKKVVLVSDAYFPKPDGLALAAEAGIKHVVTPGGSKQDEAVIAEANKRGVTMVFTGIRLFKH